MAQTALSMAVGLWWAPKICLPGQQLSHQDPSPALGARGLLSSALLFLPFLGPVLPWRALAREYLGVNLGGQAWGHLCMLERVRGQQLCS